MARFVELVASQNPSPPASSLSPASPSTAAETPSPLTLIRASETIHSPFSLQSFANTIFALLDAAEAQGGCGKPPPCALVAAKKFYFGVGGGVDEFFEAVRARGGTAELVWESGEGVGRVVLEVMKG